jgi:hypothetical protein
MDDIDFRVIISHHDKPFPDLGPGKTLCIPDLGSGKTAVPGIP